MQNNSLIREKCSLCLNVECSLHPIGIIELANGKLYNFKGIKENGKTSLKLFAKLPEHRRQLNVPWICSGGNILNV